MTDEGERGAADASSTEADEGLAGHGAPSEKPALVRLRWLKINKYRNVQPGTELRFDDGCNVVLGMNGSGKTTLLKLLAAVISCHFDFLKEEYDLEYMLISGAGEVRARAWMEPAPRGHVSIDILSHPQSAGGLGDPLPKGFERRFKATFRRADAPDSWGLSVDGEAAVLDQGSPDERPVPPSWRTSGVAMELAVMAVLLGDTHLAAIGFDGAWAARAIALMRTVRRLDESLDTLRSLTDASGDPELLQCPLVYAFDRVGLEPHFATAGHGNGGFWSAVPERLSGIGAQGLAVDLQLAGPMSALSTEFGLKVAMSVDFLRKDHVGAELAWQWRGLSFAVSLPGGSVLTEEALSYGQKRLLTFLYYLAVNKYVVIADELVNGLHHSWIKLCLERIGDRQAFLTSQNPILIDYLPPASVEQAQRQFIICRTVKTKDGEELVWRNMSEDAAERVLKAYQVGIQQLSDVLESKGLW